MSCKQGKKYQVNIVSIFFQTINKIYLGFDFQFHHTKDLKIISKALG